MVACIVPWNYPLLLLSWKLAPALAAGNTTVCKPSELTPLSTLALGAMLRAPARRRASTCSPAAATSGANLVADDGVDCVAFTGSVETGKRIAAACAERVARINLEMGGKDPFIVCSDVADRIDVAAKGGAWAAFLNAGQVCTSAERFYVMDDVYDDYLAGVRRLHRRPSRRRSDGRRPPTSARWSPRPQRQKVADQVEAAVARRSRGGDRRRHRRPASAGTSSRRRWSPAHQPRPTCCARRPSARWHRSSRSSSLDEAIELANSTRFGLGANVYTRDLRNVVRCMREIKAGTVWFNDPLTDNDAGPFGGFKQSGLGRELGREGLEAFQETKHVHIETEIAPKEWWYPYSEHPGESPLDGAGA